MLLNCLSHSLSKKARLAGINYDCFFVESDQESMEEIRQLMERRELNPVVDRVFQFEKADAAMEYLEHGHATGKVVVQIAATPQPM